MSTYAIGDVQGCYQQLQALLSLIQFDADKDTLWFTGDLVNRGPESLAVLRFVKSLGEKHITILGNHDLTLLAVAYGTKTQRSGDTMDDILMASDRDELIDWLRHLPLLHHDPQFGFVMTHAGLAPMWTLSQAISLAAEVEHALRDDVVYFLTNMYGNQPDYWRDELTGMDRLRCITNYLTRMRFCDTTGRLDLHFKGKVNDQPNGLVPWYLVPDRANQDEDIIIGHWAALNGVTHVANVHALDTGCIWGNCLTAMRLEDKKRFHVDCRSVLSVASFK